MPLTSREVVFNVPLKTKQRPRFYANNAYMDKPYKTWIAEMRALMAEHWAEAPLETVNVLWVRFHGPARGDLDNLLGAVMDAGNGLIWRDDRVSIIARVEAEWVQAKQQQQQIQMKVFYELP
jgi:Holliday junction resolvase RusA-like endonuclease